MADIYQQLEDVRKKIQGVETEKTEALAKGETSYATALVAQIVPLFESRLKYNAARVEESQQQSLQHPAGLVREHHLHHPGRGEAPVQDTRQGGRENQDH